MIRSRWPNFPPPINNEPAKVKVEKFFEVGNYTLNTFTQLCEVYEYGSHIYVNHVNLVHTVLKVDFFF